MNGDIMNAAIFILYWPAVALICVMIWKREELIAFEQRVRDRIVGLAAAAVVFIRHEVMLRRKGRVK